MFNCPFIMMTEVGAAYIDPAEAAHLRDYLLKGGFLWADDFWGGYAWEHWAREISKVLPPASIRSWTCRSTHPLFHMLFEVDTRPADPVDQLLVRPRRQHVGARRRQRRAARARHLRFARPPDGAITHNTDFGDAFEREGDDPRYFYTFSVDGYAFGINTLLYALTH